MMGIRIAIIAKEKISEEEMTEIIDIDAKMRCGERTRLDEILDGLNV